MNILGLIGTKKVEVLKYLLGNLINEENLIVVSYKEIEEELGISSRTIAQTFKILQEANFLNQIKKGIWRVNPSFLIKGKSQKRQNIMIKYVNEINERLKQKDN
jgi:predicted transcriptional regulator